MSTDTDNIVAFPGVRVAAEPATLIIGAVLNEEPKVVHRQFGINDRLTLRELSDALRIMFGWPGESAPVKFTLDGVASRGVVAGPGAARGRTAGRGGVAAEETVSVTVPQDTVIGDVLQDVGDTLTWHWGLWDHRLDVREAFARDEATPDALCIGGSGTIDAPADGPDIAAINERLTGEQSILNTLSTAREDVVDLIERSGVFEFVPLLQALDLKRSPGGTCTPEECARMRALPAEDPGDAAGRDAALATILCLSALTDEDIRHDVTSHVMDSLGWVADDGTPLTGEDVEELCPSTWAVLEELGIVGEEQVGAVAKLDLLREALRR